MKRLLLVALAVLFPGIAAAATLRVSAAASLTDVLQALAPVYRSRTGDTLLFNFGASSMLARQIQEGAPADLFISADEQKMDQLQHAHLIVTGSRRRDRKSTRLNSSHSKQYRMPSSA